MEPNDVKSLIEHVVSCFLDDKEGEGDEFTVAVNELGRTAIFLVQPKTREAAARIIGFQHERVNAVRRLVKEVGDAWRLQLEVDVSQPPRQKTV